MSRKFFVKFILQMKCLNIRSMESDLHLKGILGFVIFSICFFQLDCFFVFFFPTLMDKDIAEAVNPERERSGGFNNQINVNHFNAGIVVVIRNFHSIFSLYLLGGKTHDDLE